MYNPDTDTDYLTLNEAIAAALVTTAENTGRVDATNAVVWTRAIRRYLEINIPEVDFDKQLDPYTAIELVDNAILYTT